MVIDYEKWHDGIGYDLDALRASQGGDRRAIETVLVARGARDWRDVEALAVLDSERARGVLRAALKGGNAEIRGAVLRYAPDLGSKDERTAALVSALETADFFGGLSAALDVATDDHPPPVIDALFRGALHRKGDVACHFAAMLMYLHGCTREPFDDDQRPFFLRFNTPDRAARRAVFLELGAKLRVDVGRYLE